jgi:regulator of protease activity HflC (stomatin/prohibitin superfamily)
MLLQILSRDSVTVTVDAVVYYRVSNPTMATNNVEDYGHSTHLLGATTLRWGHPGGGGLSYLRYQHQVRPL